MRYITLLSLLFLSLNINAKTPTNELVQSVSNSVFRIQVGLQNGRYGVGSGVLIAKEHVVTNCHVVANASSVVVMKNGEPHVATAVKADWKHDVCVLKVPFFTGEIAKVNSNNNAIYTSDVFNVGFPGFLTVPQTTIGKIIGLYSLDGQKIIQTTSAFHLGESGGGLFNDNGELIGLITLRSPGGEPSYYNMPIAWATALLDAKETKFNTTIIPFWAEKEDLWPHFMKIVGPLKHEDWNSLYNLSYLWVNQEPTCDAAWFYLGLAEFKKNQLLISEQHLTTSLKINKNNHFAIYYLGLIAQENGKRIEALNKMQQLIALDVSEGVQLKKDINAD